MITQVSVPCRDSRSPEPTRRTLVRGLSGGLSALLLVRAVGAQSAGTTSETEVAARMAMGALNQALAIGDDRRLDRDFTPDVVVHPRYRLAATGEEVSPDLTGLKAALADMRGVFTSIELIVEALVAGEDLAAGRLTVRGTLAGATGPQEVSALVCMVISNSRVHELWVYPDPEAMMAIMASAPIAPNPRA